MRKGKKVWRIDGDDIIGGRVESVSSRLDSFTVRWEDQPSHDDVTDLSQVFTSEKEAVLKLLEVRLPEMENLVNLVNKLQDRRRELQ